MLISSSKILYGSALVCAFGAGAAISAALTIGTLERLLRLTALRFVRGTERYVAEVESALYTLTSPKNKKTSLDQLLLEDLEHDEEAMFGCSNFFTRFLCRFWATTLLQHVRTLVLDQENSKSENNSFSQDVENDAKTHPTKRATLSQRVDHVTEQIIALRRFAPQGLLVGSPSSASNISYSLSGSPNHGPATLHNSPSPTGEPPRRGRRGSGQSNFLAFSPEKPSSPSLQASVEVSQTGKRRQEFSNTPPVHNSPKKHLEPLRPPPILATSTASGLAFSPTSASSPNEVSLDNARQKPSSGVRAEGLFPHAAAPSREGTPPPSSSSFSNASPPRKSMVGPGHFVLLEPMRASSSAACSPLSHENSPVLPEPPQLRADHSVNTEVETQTSPIKPKSPPQVAGTPSPGRRSATQTRSATPLVANENSVLHDAMAPPKIEARERLMIGERGYDDSSANSGAVLAVHLSTMDHALESGPLEGIVPIDVVEAASALVGCALDLVRAHGGVVLSFDLSSVVASFNVQTHCPDHCRMAARCAVAINDEFSLAAMAAAQQQEASFEASLTAPSPTAPGEVTPPYPVSPASILAASASPRTSALRAASGTESLQNSPKIRTTTTSTSPRPPAPFGAQFVASGSISEESVQGGDFDICGLAWGIGLAEGKMLAGSTGSAEHRAFVLCGAALEQAKDLAMLNERLDTAIIMGQSFHDRIGQQFRTLLVDFVNLSDRVLTGDGCTTTFGTGAENSDSGSICIHGTSSTDTGVYELCGDLDVIPSWPPEALGAYIRALGFLRKGEWWSVQTTIEPYLNPLPSPSSTSSFNLINPDDTQFRRVYRLAELFNSHPELAPHPIYVRRVQPRWSLFGGIPHHSRVTSASGNQPLLESQDDSNDNHINSPVVRPPKKALDLSSSIPYVRPGPLSPEMYEGPVLEGRIDEIVRSPSPIQNQACSPTPGSPTRLRGHSQPGSLHFPPRTPGRTRSAVGYDAGNPTKIVEAIREASAIRHSSRMNVDNDSGDAKLAQSPPIPLAEPLSPASRATATLPPGERQPTPLDPAVFQLEPNERQVSDIDLLPPHPFAEREVGEEFIDINGVLWRRSQRLLGSGAFGDVFLGMRPLDGMLVAMKALPIPALGPLLASAVSETSPHKSPSPHRRLSPQQRRERKQQEKLENVMREVALLCSLRHPNVVSCFGCAVLNNQEVVMAMEYVSGGSLLGLVEQFGVVPVPAVQRYLKDVLRGLRFLHEKNIIHRDVKPGNVLIGAENAVCKLTDFGTSVQVIRIENKEQGPEEVKGKNSGFGVGPSSDFAKGLFGPGGSDVIVGTPLYMAPEQARGLNATVPESDLWSVGIMAIQMLSGTIPYTLSGPFAADKLMHDLAFDESFAPQIPQGITGLAREFIEQCLQREPERRGTAESLLFHPFLEMAVGQHQPSLGGAAAAGISPVPSGHFAPRSLRRKTGQKPSTKGVSKRASSASVPNGPTQEPELHGEVLDLSQQRTSTTTSGGHSPAIPDVATTLVRGSSTPMTQSDMTDAEAKLLGGTGTDFPSSVIVPSPLHSTEYMPIDLFPNIPEVHSDCEPGTPKHRKSKENDPKALSRTLNPGA